MNIKSYCDVSLNCPDFLLFVAEFLSDTGIRPSELWLISKSNLSYIDGKLDYFQPKTQIRRQITLSANVLRKARIYRKSYGNFAKHFRTYKNLKNCLMFFITPKVFPPDAHHKLYYFRYLYVLDKLQKRIPEEQISKLLGHSDRTTVRDYIKHALFIQKELQITGVYDG